MDKQQEYVATLFLTCAYPSKTRPDLLELFC